MSLTWWLLRLLPLITKLIPSLFTRLLLCYLLSIFRLYLPLFLPLEFFAEIHGFFGATRHAHQYIIKFSLELRAVIRLDHIRSRLRLHEHAVHRNCRFLRGFFRQRTRPHLLRAHIHHHHDVLVHKFGPWFERSENHQVHLPSLVRFQRHDRCVQMWRRGQHDLVVALTFQEMVDFVFRDPDILVRYVVVKFIHTTRPASRSQFIVNGPQ